MKLRFPELATSAGACHRSLLKTVVLLLVTSLPVCAESLTEPATTQPGPSAAVQQAQPDRITSEYLSGYLTDTGKIIVSPVQWDGSDWLAAGLVIGATAGLYAADADIRDYAGKNQGPAGRTAADVGNALGNPLYTLPPLGLLYLYGHYSEDPKARRTALLAAESLAVSGAFTWTLKMAVQRSRPFTGESPGSWHGPGFSSTNTSFPSGHTTASFSIASVIAEEYGHIPALPPIAYSLAALTGFARVYDNKHWASDVFFGGAIGYFVGKSVVRYHTGAGGSAVRVLPTVSQQGFGLMAEYRF